MWITGTVLGNKSYSMDYWHSVGKYTMLCGLLGQCWRINLTVWISGSVGKYTMLCGLLGQCWEINHMVWSTGTVLGNKLHSVHYWDSIGNTPCFMDYWDSVGEYTTLCGLLGQCWGINHAV